MRQFEMEVVREGDEKGDRQEREREVKMQCLYPLFETSLWFCMSSQCDLTTSWYS